MSISTTSDTDDEVRHAVEHPTRKRPIRQILGGEKVADVLLWENKRVSAAILLAITGIWFLFEVVEYNFLTLLCHILITTMLSIFIWSRGAEVFNWDPPRIPQILIEKSAFDFIVTVVHARLNQGLAILFGIASQKDPRLLFLALSLWMLSLVGDYVTFPNLLFIGCICLETLPYLYQCYEEDADDFAEKASHGIRKLSKKFNKKVLGRIPRGPVREKIP